MPVPSSKETKNDFISRCVPIVINEGRSKDQAVAICYSIWKKHHPGAKSSLEMMVKEINNIKEEIKKIKEDYDK